MAMDPQVHDLDGLDAELGSPDFSGCCRLVLAVPTCSLLKNCQLFVADSRFVVTESYPSIHHVWRVDLSCLDRRVARTEQCCSRSDGEFSALMRQA